MEKEKATLLNWKQRKMLGRIKREIAERGVEHWVVVVNGSRREMCADFVASWLDRRRWRAEGTAAWLVNRGQTVTVACVYKDGTSSPRLLPKIARAVLKPAAAKKTAAPKKTAPPAKKRRKAGQSKAAVAKRRAAVKAMRERLRAD